MIVLFGFIRVLQKGNYTQKVITYLFCLDAVFDSVQETTGGLLFLCVSLNPSSPPASQKEIQQWISFISRDEGSMQGVQTLISFISIGFLCCEKQGEKLKERNDNT